MQDQSRSALGSTSSDLGHSESESENEEFFEYVRPGEFDNDRDWAHALADDVWMLKERLSFAEAMLSDVATAVRVWGRDERELRLDGDAAARAEEILHRRQKDPS